MAEIIDLDFYRKFRIILHIRATRRQQAFKTHGPVYQSKNFRRKRKADVDSKKTTKD